MKVKICGFTTSSDIHNAVNLGVDAIGIVFFEDSSRYVQLDDAEVLLHDVPAFVNRVGVFVNQPIEYVNEVARKCQLDYVQLHGDETVDYCSQIERKIIKVIRVDQIDDLTIIPQYKSLVSAVLLDTKIKGLYGGSGQSFDWGIAIAAKDFNIPLILSGGLNVSNVKKAIQLVNPYGIDISSGVELEPGVKDYHKIENLIKLIRHS